MKLFINDKNATPDNFTPNTETEREYPIDTWLTDTGGSKLYLLSAYVYDGMVMFLYASEKTDEPPYTPPKTQRESLLQINSHYNITHFDYEVNHQMPESGGSSFPQPPYEVSPQDYAIMDELTKYQLGEYDYLCQLVKNRLPDELRDIELVFRKDSYTFPEPIHEITNIAIFPQAHIFKQHLLDKTFTAPYGECNIKVPYTINNTEYSVTITELKIHDLMDEFNKNYEEYKKRLDSTSAYLAEVERPAATMTMEEVRQSHDKRLLLLTYLAPKTHHSLSFYTKEYLDSEIPKTLDMNIYITDNEYDEKTGLHKNYAVLGETETPAENYVITLMHATENTDNNRKPIFEIKF